MSLAEAVVRAERVIAQRARHLVACIADGDGAAAEAALMELKQAVRVGDQLQIEADAAVLMVLGSLSVDTETSSRALKVASK